MSNRSNRWKALWNPDRYHGWGKTNNYFEGWYFKLVDANGDYALAIIPGISMDHEGKQHAFIQVLDGKACTATYHRFDAKDFQPEANQFGLHLGGNYFSASRLVLDLPELKGTLQFSATTPWPKMLYAPGIMGWFSFVPFMECYHGVVSMHHYIDGALTHNGAAITFAKGKGYIEKDWGRSFPKSWIWMQSNHFGESQKVSLSASVAHIPWLGNYFIGYIVGLQIEDKLYRFATYTGAKMKAQLGDHSVHLAFKDRKHLLTIDAEQATGGDLVSPIAGEMTGKVNESMQAIINIRLTKGEKLIFEGKGQHTGMEVAGAVEALLTKKWRR